MEADTDAVIKREPPEQHAVANENIQDLYKIYAKHVVKEEIVLDAAVYQQIAAPTCKPQQRTGQKIPTQSSILTSSNFNIPSEFLTHSTSALICDVCDEQFNNKRELISHLNEHDELSYFCTKCEETYCNEDSFKQHKDDCRRLNISGYLTNFNHIVINEKGKGIKTPIVLYETEKGPESTIINTAVDITQKEKIPECNRTICSVTKTAEVRVPEQSLVNINAAIPTAVIAEKIKGPECNPTRICGVNAEKGKYTENSATIDTAVITEKGHPSSLINPNAATPVMVIEGDKIQSELTIKQEPRNHEDWYKDTQPNVNTNNKEKQISPTELQELVSLAEKMLDDKQTNNISVKKESDLELHSAAQNVDIKQEPPDQGMSEEQMVSDDCFNHEARMVRDSERNVKTLGVMLEEPRLIKQQSVGESKSSQLYCETCNRHFCTHSILSLHHSLNHRLLCICCVCNSTIQALQEPISSTNSNTPAAKTSQRKQNLMIQQRTFLSGWEDIPQTGKDNPSQTASNSLINQAPVEIENGREIDVVEDFLEYRLDSDVRGKDMGRINLAQHLFPQPVYNDKPHNCELCSKQFAKPKYLQSHMKTHSVEKHQCPNCYGLYKSIGSLTRHMQFFCKAKTNSKRFICDRCNKGYGTNTSLLHHKKFYCYDRTQDMPFKCDVCGNRYPELKILQFHKKKHGQQFTCDYCSKIFTCRYHLERHILIHSGVKSFSCKFCDKQFTRKNRLENHEKSHTDKGSYVCDVCDKRYCDSDSLKRHKKVLCNEKVFKEKPFLCDVCKKRFTDKSAIARHITNNHARKFTCKICDKSYGQMCTLVYHMEIHNKKRIRCDVCSKKFTRTSDLAYHERMHPNNVRQYVCDTCDKKFIHHTTLFYHNRGCRKRTELNLNKNRQCDVCNKYFVIRSSLLYHKQICKVITKNPFQCDVCKRKYETKFAVSAHIKNCHTKKFTCDTCSKTYGQKSNLVYHLEHHKVLSSTVCPEICSGVTDLRKHEQLHSVSNQYPCVLCDKKIRSKDFPRVP